MKTKAYYMTRGIRTGFWLILIFGTIFSTNLVNDYYLNKGRVADQTVSHTEMKTLPSVTLPLSAPEVPIEPDLIIEKWMMIESYWTGKSTSVPKQEEIIVPFAVKPVLSKNVQ